MVFCTSYDRSGKLGSNYPDLEPGLGTQFRLQITSNKRFLAATDQCSVEGPVTRDLKLLAQDLMFDGVDAEVLGLTRCEQVLTVRRVAQRPERPASVNNAQHNTSCQL